MSDAPELVVELGEGFTDNAVTVTADDKVVWNREHVTTNYSIGLADIARVPISAPPRVVGVRAGTSSTSYGSATIELTGTDVPRLRCSMDSNHNLQISLSPEMPIF